MESSGQLELTCSPVLPGRFVQRRTKEVIYSYLIQSRKYVYAERPPLTPPIAADT